MARTEIPGTGSHDADSRGAAIRHAFLFRLIEDRRRGVKRSLAEYQAQFPGFEALIADAYESSVGEDDEPKTVSLDDARVVGRFEILREIGRGGQGTVFLARDPKLTRFVALKLLAPRFAQDSSALARFRHEAQAASRLDHPGICPVHEIGEVQGQPYIVMPYVQGESLAHRLRHAGGLPSGEAEVFPILECVERAARAAHAAHEASIVHRDLKPGNIMVNELGQPVILDFGLAHDEEQSVSLTLSGDVFGTPAYMAPEQIDDSRRADRRTDVYSLGVVLFELLTLRRPFTAPTREGLYGVILNHEPPDPRRFNRSLSRDVKAILDTCLAKDAGDRYATAAGLADDLQRIQRRELVHARSAGPVLRFQRWVRRDPALAGTVLGLLATLSLVFGVTNSMALMAADSLAEEQRLADLQTFAYLQHQAVEELWPVLPERLPAMNEWRAEAESLLERANLAANEAAAIEHALADVRKWFAEASELSRRTLEDYRDDWEATIAAIADTEANPQYGGLRLEPQLGLAPVGQDPDSGLFEFGHLQTGHLPLRDPDTGRLWIAAETGLVFVLIPGGRFCMGLMWPSGTTYTGPEHWLELDPFFLSKYEMTQAQWLRTTGSLGIQHDDLDVHLDHPRTPMDPVVNVSWTDCVAALRRHGLVLPTESQWEYAASAGTRTRFWTGESLFSLQGAANIADQSAERAGRSVVEAAKLPDYDDAYPCLAPVGRFRPNPFGLHDVHGNVWEFVSDVRGSYEHPPRRGDGKRLPPESGERILRGGSFVDAQSANARYRYHPGPEKRYLTQGLRPSRSIRNSVPAAGP